MRGSRLEPRFVGSLRQLGTGSFTRASKPLDYFPDGPGRVVPWLGPSAEVLGVLPTPCWLFTPPPTFVPVVPCIPVVTEVDPVPVVPPEAPAELLEVPADPPADAPPDPPP